MIAVCDEKAIHYMLMQKTSHFPKPPEEVRGLERLTGRGLLTVEGDVHRRQRKIMSPSFTQLQTNSYLPIFTEQAETVSIYGHASSQLNLLTLFAIQLAARLEKVVDAEKNGDGSTVVNMCIWLSRATLEVISQAGFGYKVGSLEQDDHELINAFNLMLRPRPLSALLFLIIRLLNKVPVLARLPFPMVKAAKRSMALMKEEAKFMLGDKLEMADSDEIEGRKDLLSCIVRANKLATSEKDKMLDDEVSLRRHLSPVATWVDCKAPSLTLP